MSTVMISCGEASGDLYAGALADELRRRDPGCHIVGFGGDRLRQAGAELVGEYRGLAVTGLTEALRVLPRSYGMYRRLVGRARADRPDVFVAIDFPDFNFRVAASLHRMGVPVVYYVGPQMWAWRPQRIHAMARFVSKVLVIFPFETQFYQRAGIPVQFVGHPLVDLARASDSREAVLTGLGLGPGNPTLAVLPGSRINELQSTVPVLADALPLIRACVPNLQAVVARAPHLPDRLLRRLEEVAVPVALVEGRTDDVLNAADVVITASGTATVQATLHGRPMVIVYRVSPLTFELGRRFVHVNTFGMPNLLAGRAIVPELIQSAFTADRVASETVRFFNDPTAAAAARQALAEVRATLGGPGATGRAAEAVLGAIQARGSRAAALQGNG
jgi:lipid-A-disaccharide synthase